ncbi:MAG TPA: LysR family transcriptional regulator [Candidatus Acidoferrum sp.]|nr:LysR family transcriptional regulator [Candidatus Acidoferrum sp.]
MIATIENVELRTEELEVFVAFARTEHLGRTAESLGRSVSSIQRTVRALELRLGVPLVERDGRRVKLLHAGRVLADHAARVLRARSEAVTAVLAASGPHLSLRLGHMFSLGLGLVPRIAAAALARDPSAHLLLRHGPTNALVTSLLAGEVDAVLVSPLPLAADLTSVPLFTEPLLAAVAGNDPLAAADAIALGDLRDRPFVALPEGAGSRYDLVQACARAGFTPRIAIEVGDMYTLEGIVGAGLAVSVVPASMRGHTHPALTRVPLREPAETHRRVGLVYVRGTETRRAVAALIDAVTRVVDTSSQR